MLLLAQVLTQALNFILQTYLGISDTSKFTTAYYIAVLVYSIWVIIKTYSMSEFLNKLGIYLGFVFVFALSYLLYPKTRTYYTSVNMTIVMTVFLPISIYIISEIIDWKELINSSTPYTAISILLSSYVVLFMEYRNLGNYMEFSYPLLPFVCLSFWNMRTKFGFLNVALFLLGLFDLLVFGARATLIFLFLFIVVFEVYLSFTGTKASGIKWLILILVGLVAFFFLESINSFLYDFAIEYDSRFLIKLLNGDLFMSTGREELTQQALKHISELSLKAHGFFGDRLLLENYCHNIAYELILSVGWILSCVCLIWFVFYIYKLWVSKNSFEKMIFIMLFFALFCRFFVSASFVETGSFYMFIFALVGMAKCKSVNSEETGPVYEKK